jgi:hypothetical protein
MTSPDGGILMRDVKPPAKNVIPSGPFDFSQGKLRERGISFHGRSSNGDIDSSSLSSSE